MDNLNKLTVVIPTYERQKYILRQVELWQNTSARIIILDGSESSWIKLNSYKLPSNFQYFHIPESIEKRLRFVIKEIQTEYAVLLSEDEIYIHSAIKNCIAFLDTNPDYAVCKGVALGFNYSLNQVTGFPVYKSLQGYKIEDEKPEDRLNAHMSNYAMAVLWGITRTVVFKKTLNAMAQGPFLSAAAGEMQCSIIGAWSGKIKVINELMWLRSSENKNIWWSFGNLQFHDWYRNSENKIEIQKYISSILVNIDGFGYPIEKIEKLIQIGIDNYIQLCLNVIKQREIKTKPNLSFTSLVFWLKKLTNNLIYLIKRVLSIVLNLPTQRTLIQSAIKLKNSGINIDIQQLIHISSLIKEFHNRKIDIL